MRVSVVVATYQGASVIGQGIQGLLDQTLDPDQYEVIVVDDGSTDGVADVAEAMAATRPSVSFLVLRRPVNEGLAVARNVGAAAARGDIVAFVDDDAVPDPDWLERLLEGYGPGIAGVGGFARPMESTTWAAYALARTWTDYGRRGEKVDGAGGQNMSFRLEVLEHMAFDPLFRTVADDADFNRRLGKAGHKLRVLADVTVGHRAPANLLSFLSKSLGRGAGAALFHRKGRTDPLGLRGWGRLCFQLVAWPAVPWTGLRLERAIAEGLHPDRTPGPISWNDALKLGLVDWMDRTLQASAFTWIWIRHVVRTVMAPIRTMRSLGLRAGMEGTRLNLTLPWGPALRSPRVVCLGPTFKRSWGRLGWLWVKALAGAGHLEARIDEPAAYLPPGDLYVAVAGFTHGSFERLAALSPATLRVLRRECTHSSQVEALLAQAAQRLGVQRVSASREALAAERREYELSDFIVVPGQISRDGFLAQGVAAQRLVTLRPGIDRTLFHPAQGKRSVLPTIVFVGLVGLRKGVPDLVDAWHRLGSRSIRLEIVGPLMDDLPARTRAALQEPGIRWRRRVAAPELVGLYRSAWVVALPSVQDGWGLSVHEGMACGTPAVVTVDTGVAELVAEVHPSLVVARADVDALALSLDRLLTDRTVMEDLGQVAARVAGARTEADYGAEAVALARQLAARAPRPDRALEPWRVET